jgi:hypothetical protein
VPSGERDEVAEEVDRKEDPPTMVVRRDRNATLRKSPVQKKCFPWSAARRESQRNAIATV